MVTKIGENLYFLKDTRPISRPIVELILNERQAAVALVQKPLKRVPLDWDMDWAIKNNLGDVLDERWVPFATADYNLLQEFESKYAKGASDIILTKS